MSTDALGLNQVPTQRLKLMLRQLHRQELPCPLSVAGVVGLGLQDHLPAVMHVMRDLDARGVRAVLIAVLAEREGQASR